MSDMPGKPAKPERFMVERIGTPDPPSTEYYVLDLVNDFDCRVALGFLGRSYDRRGMAVKSEECFQALRDTEPAFKAVIDQRNEIYKKAQKKGGQKERKQS